MLFIFTDSPDSQRMGSGNKKHCRARSSTPDGAAVANAAVTVTPVSGGFSSKGAHRPTMASSPLPELPEGAYKVEVELFGLQTSRSSEYRTWGQPATADIRVELQRGDTRENRGSTGPPPSSFKHGFRRDGQRSRYIRNRQRDAGFSIGIISSW